MTVSSVNKTLIGGEANDGSIYEAVGPRLVDDCQKLDVCETGDCKVTPGCKLPDKHVSSFKA